MAHELSHVLLRHGTANATKAAGLPARPARRRDRRRGRRRRLGPDHLAGQPVRPRHGAAEIQPRVREAGRPARRADHGARGLRPARSRPHVRDDSEGVARRRAAVAEQPPRSGQPLGLHREGSRNASGDAARNLRRRVSRRRADSLRRCRRPSPMAELGARDAGGGAPRTTGTARRSAESATPFRRPRRSSEPSRAATCSRSPVPQNWQAVSSTNAVKFVPPNGYGAVNGGQSVFTHGVELGVAARVVQGSSRRDARARRRISRQSNPDLRQTSEPARHPAVAAERPRSVARQPFIPRRNRTDRHLHDVSRRRQFVLRRDDRSRRRSGAYGPVFDRIARSIRLRDAR